MGVNYAGLDLLLEDIDGNVRQWLDDWIEPEELRHVTEYPASVWNSPLGLTQPNWPEPIRAKLNCWVSPTGASRWGYGLFLVNSTMKAQLVQAATNAGALLGQAPTSGGSVSTLILTDDQNKLGIAINAGMLPPHPVSADNGDPNALWIIPLVDERYFWANRATSSGGLTGGVLSSSPFPTWGTAIVNAALAISAQIDTTSVPAISSNYLSPGQWDFTRMSFQNAAVQFDVLLASIGMRLIPINATLYGGMAPGGLYKSNTMFQVDNYQSATTRMAARNQPTEYVGLLQAGFFAPNPGDLGTLFPQSVQIAFRSFQNGITLPDQLNARYTQTYTPASLGFTNVTPTLASKTIRSTALANFTGLFANGTAGPDNLTTLTNLSKQIASDFYGWFNFFYDTTVIGIFRGQQCGFDNVIEYRVGHRRDDGSYEMRTRVQSMAGNFTCDDLLHWDSTVTNWTFTDASSTVHNGKSPTWEWGQVVFGSLQGNLPANGQQVIAVTSADVPVPAVTQPDATSNAYLIVNDVLGNAVNGGKVCAIRDGNKWAAIDPTATPLMLSGSFQSATVVAPNSGTFTLTGGGTVTATVPYGAGIQNKTYLVSQTDAGTYQIVNPTMALHCQTGTLTVGAASLTVTLYGGTLGSESSLTTTVTAYLRRGVAFLNTTYALEYFQATGWEITDPSRMCRGQCTSDTATDAASGTFTIFTGTGNGTTTSVTISTVFNPSSCTIKANKTAAAYWVDDIGTWQFFNGHTS